MIERRERGLLRHAFRQPLPPRIASRVRVSDTMLKTPALAHAEAEAEAKGFAFKPAGVAAQLASVDEMMAEAKRRWAARGMPGEVGFLRVRHVGDANAYVSIFRAGSDRVALVGQGVHFAGSTGRVIREDPPPTAIASVNEFLTGLHLQHFRHWLLRWLYVLGGLAGCVCIATRFIFFVEKRKRRHAEHAVASARWADALAVTAVTGMLIAALAILVANRLLPEDLAHRGEWQEGVFWTAWLATLAHALLRTAPVREARLAPAGAEQCGAAAVLAATAVVSNWVTTGDHLVRTVASGYWPVAGFDLALLVTAALSVFAAWRLRARSLAGIPRRPKPPARSAVPDSAGA